MLGIVLSGFGINRAQLNSCPEMGFIFHPGIQWGIPLDENNIYNFSLKS